MLHPDAFVDMATLALLNVARDSTRFQEKRAEMMTRGGREIGIDPHELADALPEDPLRLIEMARAQGFVELKF